MEYQVPVTGLTGASPWSITGNQASITLGAEGVSPDLRATADFSSVPTNAVVQRVSLKLPGYVDQGFNVSDQSLEGSAADSYAEGDGVFSEGVTRAELDAFAFNVKLFHGSGGSGSFEPYFVVSTE